MDSSGDCELSAAKASAEEAGLNLTRYDFYRMILFLASPTIFLRFFSLPRAFILTALALSYDKSHISGDKRFSKRLLILFHLEYYFFFFLENRNYDVFSWKIFINPRLDYWITLVVSFIQLLLGQLTSLCDILCVSPLMVALLTSRKMTNLFETISYIA